MEKLNCKTEYGEFEYHNRGEYSFEDCTILSQIAMSNYMEGRSGYTTSIYADDKVVFDYERTEHPQDFVFTVTMLSKGRLEIYGVKEGKAKFNPKGEGIPIDLGTEDGMLRAIKVLDKKWTLNGSKYLNVKVVTDRNLFDRLCRLRSFGQDFILFVR